MKAVQKMNSCPACQGFPELRPCSNYCINVMKGCLAFHIETQDMWDKFVGKCKNIVLTLKWTHPNQPTFHIQVKLNKGFYIS